MQFQDFIKRLLNPMQFVDEGHGPPAYRAYTREFDRVISGQDAACWAPDSVPEPLAEFPDEPNALDCLVTILIDHSGSLRGAAIRSVVKAVEALGDRLDELNLPYDVLGYTTSSWRGGESYKKWVDEGQLANPGRVCDLLHIVYRDAGRPTASWRDDLRKALVHRPILKENVDGEAVEWARERAVVQSANRWVLLVVSDGAPTDDGTLKANRGRGYSEHEVLRGHLREVMGALGEDLSVVVGALGIGWAVDAYYPINQVVMTDNQASERAEELLNELLVRSEATATGG